MTVVIGELYSVLIQLIKFSYPFYSGVHKGEYPAYIALGVPTFDVSGLVRVDNKCCDSSILTAKALLILMLVLINDSGR